MQNIEVRARFVMLPTEAAVPVAEIPFKPEALDGLLNLFNNQDPYDADLGEDVEATSQRLVVHGSNSWVELVYEVSRGLSNE